MASNFNNDPLGRTPATIAGATSRRPTTEAGDGPVTSVGPQSTAFVRFTFVPVEQPAEKATSRVLHASRGQTVRGHARDSIADAWCIDCQYYKLRRAPKKRTRTSDDYELLPSSSRTPSPDAPIPRWARAAGRPSSAAAPPATGRSSPASPPDRNARRRRSDSAAAHRGSSACAST